MPDQVLDTTVKTETSKANPDHSLIFKDITAQAIVIHIEATLDHGTEIDAAITEASHDNLTPTTVDTATYLTVTPLINHITDYPKTEALQATNPNIIVGHTHDHPSSRHELHHLSSQSSRMKIKSHSKKNMKVKIEDPCTDYYNSDDHSSDSGEEFDP